MQQLIDMSDEHLTAVRGSIEAEYPGCGVAVIIMKGIGHQMVSNVARPVLVGHLEHIVLHLRGTCQQCGDQS